MAWYTSSDNCINRPPFPDTWKTKISQGMRNVCETIASRLLADIDLHQRPCFLALDGYKGVKFTILMEGISSILRAKSVDVVPFNVNQVFWPRDMVDRMLHDYDSSDDPSFGRVFSGVIDELTVPSEVCAVIARWKKLRAANANRQVVICYGMGAAMAEWVHLFDRVAYCDTTREQIMIQAERNELLPIGGDAPVGFPWKRIYYVEYPVLNRHKKKVLKNIDWYIDATSDSDLILIPGDIYHALITEMSGRPLSFKVFYMPGTFGGSEFGRRFNVSGLPNTSWDYEISVGDNHVLVDVGADRVLEMPLYNIFWEQPIRFLGSYSSTTYPDHFPIAIYMQDGYFPTGDKAQFKRTHMPHHLHPDTAYCREHFNEPIGRYETYYIVRADEGACTMHGFREGANIEEYVKEVERAAKTGQEFDWRRYVHEYPSKTGELHQLPPGTVHGTGGRQIILEIDTNPSRESTEYSFYLYDYCRPNFNYERNDFTGKPAKLQLEHSLAVMRKNRQESFMDANCRPAPAAIRQGSDWREMSFPMYFTMPYQINRLEFQTTIEDDTREMFHCLALTLGEKVRVYSKRMPSNEFILEDCDNIVLPACFGEYVCENLGSGSCEIVKVFLITEPRDHIDKEKEEAHWDSVNVK